MFLKFVQMLSCLICQCFGNDTDGRTRDLQQQRTVTVGCRVAHLQEGDAGESMALGRAVERAVPATAGAQ